MKNSIPVEYISLWMMNAIIIFSGYPKNPLIVDTLLAVPMKSGPLQLVFSDLGFIHSSNTSFKVLFATSTVLFVNYECYGNNCCQTWATPPPPQDRREGAPAAGFWAWTCGWGWVLRWAARAEGSGAPRRVGGRVAGREWGVVDPRRCSKCTIMTSQKKFPAPT